MTGGKISTFALTLLVLASACGGEPADSGAEDTTAEGSDGPAEIEPPIDQLAAYCADVLFDGGELDECGLGDRADPERLTAEAEWCVEQLRAGHDLDFCTAAAGSNNPPTSDGEPAPTDAVTTSTEAEQSTVATATLTTDRGYVIDLTIESLTAGPAPADPGISSIDPNLTLTVHNVTPDRALPGNHTFFVVLGWRSDRFTWDQGTTPGGQTLTASDCASLTVSPGSSSGEALCVTQLLVNAVREDLSEGESVTIDTLQEVSALWLVRDADADAAAELFASPDYVRFVVQDNAGHTGDGDTEFLPVP